MATVRSINALSFIVDELLDVLTDTHVLAKKVVWYGKTTYTDVIQKALIHHGKRLDFVVDTYAEHQGTIGYDSLLCVPIDYVEKWYPNEALYIISSIKAERIEDKLVSLGVKKDQIVKVIAREDAVRKAYDFFTKETVGLRKMSLKDIQSTLFDALVTFRDFCEANRLKYMLGGGTLLGAVRHKGFIPWDDDVDVYMPYEDYLIFIKTYPRGGRYEVIHWDAGDEDVFDIAGFGDNDTTLIDGRFLSVRKKPLTMCVIPYNGAPSNILDFKSYLAQKAQLDFLWYKNRNERDVLGSVVPDLHQDIERLKRNTSTVGSDISVQLHNFVKEPSFFKKIKKRKPFSLNVLEQTMYEGRYINSDIFQDVEMLEFENEAFAVPKKYRDYLRRVYPFDYRVVPPEGFRQVHEKRCYFNRDADCVLD